MDNYITIIHYVEKYSLMEITLMEIRNEGLEMRDLSSVSKPPYYERGLESTTIKQFYMAFILILTRRPGKPCLVGKV